MFIVIYYAAISLYTLMSLKTGFPARSFGGSFSSNKFSHMRIKFLAGYLHIET